MNKENPEAFAREAAKTIKREQDLNDCRARLTRSPSRPRSMRSGTIIPAMPNMRILPQIIAVMATRQTLRTEAGQFELDTPRETVATFQEMYGADASAALVSKVTDAVIEQVVEWQSRPLDAV